MRRQHQKARSTKQRSRTHQQTGRGVRVWRLVTVDAANEAPFQAAPRQQKRLHIRRNAKRKTLVVSLANARVRASGGAARTPGRSPHASAASRRRRVCGVPG